MNGPPACSQLHQEILEQIISMDGLAKILKLIMFASE